MGLALEAPTTFCHQQDLMPAVISELCSASPEYGAQNEAYMSRSAEK